MNILVVYAHPEPRSLNGSLLAFTKARLEAAGHTVEVSDLYAMHWKAQLDADDFQGRDPEARLDLVKDSNRAFHEGRQRDDIAAEQAKLLRADAVIFQFPLWWYSMPAILKGWIDRVYANGFAYGVGEFSDRRYGNRFGEGAMAGKRAMLVVTTGGWESHYSATGINGPMDDVLFPIQHGVLFYPGFSVLPPFVVYRTSRVDYDAATRELGARLDALFTTPPIAFRTQNGGDYSIPALELRPELVADAKSFAMHVATQPRG